MAGQTSSSNDTSPPPVKKIIIAEDDEAPPKSAKTRNKVQRSSSPADAAQIQAPSQLKKDAQSTPPEPDHTQQPVTPAQQSVVPANTRTSNPETISRLRDRWLQPYLILAAILVLIGLGALAIAFRQFWEMKRARKQAEALLQRAFEVREDAEQNGLLIEQAIERANAAAEQARAASAAAFAAKTSSESFAQTAGSSVQNIHLAQQAMHMEQRAWIFVTETHVTHLQVGEPLTVTLVLRNNGRTQARNVQIATHIDPLAKGRVPEPKLERAEDRGIIPPNGTLLFNIKRGCGPSEGLTEQCLQGIFSGDLVVWVYGTIHYEDVFDTRQATMFCYMLQPDGKTFHAAEIYNDAT